jgi:hypothetical protein
MKTGASQHTFLQAYSDTGDFNLFVDDNLNGYIIYTRCFVLQPSTKKSIVVLVFGSCFILILIPHYSHIAGYDTTHRISIEGLDDSYTISHMNESQRYQFRCLFYLEFESFSVGSLAMLFPKHLQCSSATTCTMVGLLFVV